MKKAIMYGAGNIGRGFIGQLFYLSNYEIIFIDINEDIVNEINTKKEYPIYITKNGIYDEFIVKNIRAINGKDTEAVANEIANCDIMATAVGVNILKYIVSPIAKGIKLRYENRCKPFNIIICENKIDADKYLRELISNEFDSSDVEKSQYFNDMVGLVEASIGRMVPATPSYIREKNKLAICVEEYCSLPVDRNGFKGDIPKIENMIPSSPFELYIQRKLYMHNMSHAITAYFGAIENYDYIWQATNDMNIKFISLSALMEISTALSKEHNIDISILIEHSYNLLSRFKNKLLNDPVYRVGYDTKRKLHQNDRIVGAIKLCLKHDIMPTYIMSGLAAGLLFSPSDDVNSTEIFNFTEKYGVKKSLEKYCDITDNKIQYIIENFYNILKEKNLSKLLEILV